MSRLINASLLLLLLSVVAAAAQDRALQVGSAIGKLARLEAMHHRNGTTLPEALARADSLYGELMNSYKTKPAVDFVNTGDGEWIGEIVTLMADLDEPPAGDPAGRLIAALEASDAVSQDAKGRLDGYGGEFLLALEGRRYLRMLLGTPELLARIGLPVTLADLGLSRADSATVKAIAEAAGDGGAGERGSEAYLFYSAMLDLDDLGGRFGNQQDEADMAGRVMNGAAYAELEAELKALPAMTIVFFGDSQTDNRHWSSSAHYPKIVEEVFRRINPAVKIYNAGIGGDDSGEGLERMDADVLAHDPDICFVLFGGNDCAHWGGDHPTVSVEQYGENIETIVTKLKADSCRPVLMSYPRLPAPDPQFGELSANALRQMNERQKEIRDKYWTGWIGLAEEFNLRDPVRMFAVDKIHFCPEAHALLAEIILRYLVEHAGDSRPGSGLQGLYDFNGDGRFNVGDALALLTRALIDPGADRYDLDGDGAGGTPDVVALLRILAGTAPML